MPIVRESLLEIVKSISAAYQSGSLDIQFNGIVDRLEALIEPATEAEKDTVRYLISLMNLLLELRRGIFLQAVADSFLMDVTQSLDRPLSLEASLLKGEEAHAEADPEIKVGCTMMKWSDFIRYYAPRYGAARSPSDLEKLWRRIEAGELRVPREDLHLSSSSGVVWITDEEALNAQCQSQNPGEVDGTRAYDALGLDWASGWRYGVQTSETRALVLTAPASYRRRANGGLRVPTSIDAWGGLGFVPKQAALPRTWPSNAGSTVDPTSGSEYLPEAIHGPALITSGAACPVVPCTPVRKANPDRVDECGKLVCMRAIVALRAG